MRAIYILIIISLIFNTAPVFSADDAEGGGGGDAVEEIRSGLKSDIRIIFFSGLGGAVLGLSTLSFVQKPSKELKRVLYGAALGAIFASVIVLYKTTSKSMSHGGGSGSMFDSYDSESQEEDSEEEYEDEEGEEEDEEDYDEDFYGSVNSFYLASYSKKKFRFSVPLVDFVPQDDKGFMVKANLFRMTF